MGVAQAADTWLSAHSSLCVQPPSAPRALALQPLPFRASQSRSPHSGGFQRLRITRKASKDTLPCGQGPQQSSHSGHHDLIALWARGGQGRVPFLSTTQLGSLGGSHRRVSTAVVLSAHRLAGVNFSSAVGLPGEIVSPWRSARASSTASSWCGAWHREGTQKHLVGWLASWVDRQTDG